MAGSAGENYEVEKSVIGFSSAQSSCQSNEDLAEWRLPEQVDNGTPSTSPSYWDTNDDNNYGPRPFELYTDFTWEIEEFKMISKRELRSEVFEVGNYKWHILIYPQGCDICNHLSLFLCVANHDKLLPGWSHFAQFTITVVNRDSKKSKYSDTLHRFWKKEHDWGWKKFMELSKVEDGFIVDDKLVIKAQVQVIREKAHRLFRCLDCGYRRELVRVYLPNVEQICWRFLNERRGKLGKLIEDKTKWSSFCAFWLGVDRNSRLQMSREKTEVVLKVLIKHFFIEKEVTSTLVMDSLFSGLKALECQSKRKKCREMLLETKDTQAPIVFVEKDMFFLADDVLSLLERAAREPLPPKDEKGPQNRMKDGSSGEDINNDSINCDERRLTELGRRTIEIFILAHIFSNRIEVAYQEAVALKRQEELIREEEAAIRAANERKAKHIAAENLSKKKQAKQSRNSRKRKDKRRKEKSDVLVQGKHHQEKHIDERKLEEFFEKQVAAELEMPEAPEDASELSDLEDVVTEKVQHDFEGRDASRVHWDTDILEIHHVTEAHSNGRADKRSPSVVDDSSSTCSTDSVPSMVTNGPYKRNSLSNCKKQTSPSREMNQRGKKTRDWGAIWSNEMNDHLSVDVGCVDDAYGNCRATEPNSEAISFLKDLGEEADLMQRKPSLKDQLNGDRPSKQPTSMETPSSPSSSSTSSSYNMEPKVESRVPTEPATGREILLDHPRELDQAVPIVTSLQIQGASKLEAQELEMVSKSMFIPIEKPVMDKIPVISRPLSAPIIPGTGLGASFISMVETAPTLSRSVSEVGRLGTNFSPATPSYIPHSYRNTTIGDGNGANPAGFTPHCSNSTLSLPSSYPQQPSSLAPRSGFTFGTVTPEKLQSSPHLMAECSQGGASSVIHEASLSNNICNLRLYGSGSIAVDELPARVPAAHASGILADEFPHLDLINYLLEEEHSNGKAAKSDTGLQRPNNGHPNILNRHFTFPDDVGMSANMGLLSADQPVSYHGNGIQRVYASSNGHFDELRDLVPQVGLLPPYSNGNIDGLMQDQFPVGDNLFFRDLRNREGYRCPYHMPDYSNLASRVRTYNVLHL